MESEEPQDPVVYIITLVMTMGALWLELVDVEFDVQPMTDPNDDPIVVITKIV